MKLSNGLKTSVFMLILALAFAYSVVLVANVNRQMDALGEAHGGDAIWSLSQLEVEYRKFTTALALAEGPEDFPAIRHRFDILYSRVLVVQEGEITRLHAGDPMFLRNLEKVTQFLRAAVPYIDSDDTMLQSELPKLIMANAEIDPLIRELALSGVTTATKTGTQLRETGRWVLTQLIVTTLFLILGMAVLIFILRRLYRQAQQGEQAKGKLLAVMSHEIRTPLNGILGAADLLQATQLDATQKRYVAAMQTSGDVLMGHVNDVLEMSRLNAEDRRKAIRPMTLPQIVTDLVHSQSMAAAKNGNRLEVKILDGVPDRVLGDVQGIQQTLLNLLGNALKFTQDGSIAVEIDTIGDSDWIEFRVSDTGAGIAESELPHVFDDFFTGDGSNSRRQQGAGLGLGITRRIVKAMGGEIGVDSIHGEGSLFWFRLPMPRLPSIDVPPDSSHDTPLSQMRAKILLVEDNQINRMITGDMLRNAGHLVTQAVDGAEGLERAKAKAFDLILMDISMPGMDGFATAKAIRVSGGPSAQTPIFALTAQTLPPKTNDITEAGMGGVFHKPMTAEALNRAVISAISQNGTPQSEAEPPEGPLLRENILGDVIRNIGIHAAQAHCDELRQDMTPLVSLLEEDAPLDQAGLDLVHKLAGAAAILGLCRLHRALAAYERSATEMDAQSRHTLTQHILATWSASDDALLQFLNSTDQTS